MQFSRSLVELFVPQVAFDTFAAAGAVDATLLHLCPVGAVNRFRELVTVSPETYVVEFELLAAAIADSLIDTYFLYYGCILFIELNELAFNLAVFQALNVLVAPCD